MFKTGIITDEVSQDLDTAIKLATEFHLDALEIRSVNEKNVFGMTEEDYKNIKDKASDAGLAICCLGSPLFKCDITDQQAIQQHMEALHRAIEGAHIMGAKLIRGFSFWRNDCATEERIAQLYQPVIEIADREDITVVLESEPSVNTGNMAQLASLLKTINSPRIGALYDPGNEICDPQAPSPYPDGYHVLAPYIAHVHIKDMVRTKDGYSAACIGSGQVDFDSIFKALNMQYTGYATLETHWRVLHKMDEEIMMRPQGSSFSAGGEEASRICLEILKNHYHFGE